MTLSKRAAGDVAAGGAAQPATSPSAAIRSRPAPACLDETRIAVCAEVALANSDDVDVQRRSAAFPHAGRAQAGAAGLDPSFDIVERS